jgi:hypothetical protein
MSDGKLHVGHAHRLEPRPAPPVLLPGRGQRNPQHPESFPANRRQQRLLVRKMPVEGRPRHAELLAGGAQGQALDALALNRAHRFLDQRPAQIAVMVLARALLFRPCFGGTRHRRRSYDLHVDTVNTVR